MCIRVEKEGVRKGKKKKRITWDDNYFEPSSKVNRKEGTRPQKSFQSIKMMQ
jgi:hypothetical protein